MTAIADFEQRWRQRKKMWTAALSFIYIFCTRHTVCLTMKMFMVKFP